jgi:hypothetical protein
MVKKDQFWSSTTVDPKRSFRWILVLNQIPTYVIKTAAKPSFTVSNIAHQFVSHTFYYPGRITWSEIEVVLVDPVFPDASAVIAKVLQASGYALPGTQGDAERSFSKADAVAALGAPQIQQLDGRGNAIEKWTLRNAWIEAANFGSLSYEDENMLNISMTFRYDWAEYEGAPQGPGEPAQEIMVNGQNQAGVISNYQKELGMVGG